MNLFFKKVLQTKKGTQLSEKTKKTYSEHVNVYFDFCTRNELELSFKSANLYLDFMLSSNKSISYINSLKFLLAKGLDIPVSSFPKFRGDKNLKKKLIVIFLRLNLKKFLFGPKKT